MKRIAIAWPAALALVLFTSAAPARAADDLPKAETILDKYVEATGGLAAYDSHHNEVVTGTMEVASAHITGKLTSYHAAPVKMYTEIDIEGLGKMQDGTDGTVAWSLSAMQGAHLKDGDEKAMALRTARFAAEAHWRDDYPKVETVGLETVNGKPCYRVLLTPKQGSPITQYFDKATGLLEKLSATVKTPMGDVATESIVGDYRKEGGILVPHTMHQSAMGQEIVVTFETVKFDTDIPKDRFDLPADIQALLKK
jgi:outer membrane lipoprotein-sorting protein